MFKFVMPLLIATFLSSFTLANTTTSNPMEMAIERARFFSQGEIDDPAGWKGCTYTPHSTPARPHIECRGTTQSMVYGSVLFAEAFICTFEFERTGEIFALRRQSCDY